jgi:hypothetical protein
MVIEYPTKYKDANGVIDSKIITDGKSIKINLRGVDFEGIHFWELHSQTSEALDLTKEFNFSEDGYLTGYSMEITMPIKVVTNQNSEIDATIEFEMNNEKIKIIIDNETYYFGRPNFEYGLNPTFTKIPNVEYIKCCTNCTYSEYSPFGCEDYGDLMCFKNSKEAWEKIGYQGLKDTENWDNLIIEKTQEAFWCGEFKKRKFDN